MSASVRRPIRSRDSAWAAAVARWLARRGVRPNTISVLSAVFAGAAGACLACLRPEQVVIVRVALLAGAVVGIQLRLLCNLFDGMVAIEEGRKTPSGAIYNELPDRFADSFLLIGAGYALPAPDWSSTVGWLAAVLAVTTAYVRALGASAGARQHFVGPMAKPHRMALMTTACLLAMVLELAPWPAPVVAWALVVISVGCAWTIVRRSRLIVRDLEGA